MKPQTYIIAAENSNMVRSSVAQRILDLEEGKPWKVTIEPYRKKRSLDQNALMHMWETVIARETGNSKDAVHKRLMQEFLTPRIETVMGQTAEVYTTTKLNVAEMQEYLTNIHSFAADWGILLPLPEELHLEPRP